VLRYYAGIFPKDLKRITDPPSLDSCSPDRYSHPGPHEYETEFFNHFTVMIGWICVTVGYNDRISVLRLEKYILRRFTLSVYLFVT
jgi:hypothetical protein